MLKKDFLWGGSVSSMQTEGAWDIDGKGLSNYDVKEVKKGNSDWKNAIDFYHRYKDDIKLFAEMGISGYRFSISWPRVMPGGGTKINEKGLDFYENVVDEMLANHIEPIICMHHYDVPQELVEQYGGWWSKEFVEAFKHYTEAVVNRLGKKVKYWFPFNEQNALMSASYVYPMDHMSSKEIDEKSIQAVHNGNVAGAYLRYYVKKVNPDAMAGGMIHYAPYYPIDCNPDTVNKTKRIQEMYEYSLLDVMALGEYSSETLLAWERYNIMPDMTEDELKLIKENTVEFIGFSYYVSRVISENTSEETNPEELTKLLWAMMSGQMEKNPYLTQTDWEWTIDEKGLRTSLIDMYRRYKKPLIVLECGLGVVEELNIENTVEDDYRIDYLRNHIQEVKKAVEIDGVDCLGFLTWGPIDILSSKGEMKKRYGFIYVDRDEEDLKDMKRYKKKSFNWYQNVIATNGEEL